MHAAQVYYALMIEPDISQKDICDRTGCDKSTVSIIINRLEELGVVARTLAVKSGHRGRPKDRLRIVEDAGLLIGVHLEPPLLRFTAAGIAGAPLKVWTRDLPDDPNRLGDAIHKGLSQLRKRLGKSVDEALSIGVSLPGLVQNDGQLLGPAWQDVDILGQLGDQVNVPVFVGNETRGAALAEHYFGAARGANDFLMVRAGKDVAGVAFLDGAIYGGVDGYAGQIGHTKVVRHGRPCQCGSSGCLAAYLSHDALIEQARETDPSIETFDMLIERARDKDPGIVDMLRESGELVGLAIANMVNALNVPLFIPAGHLVKLWPFIEPGFTTALAQNSLAAPLKSLRTRLSQLRSETFPLAGTAIALEGLVSVAIPGAAGQSSSEAASI